MKRARLNRRALIGSLAGLGITAGLSSFLPKAAWSAGEAPPKRLLLVFHPMGWLEDYFFPTGTATDFTLGESVTAFEPLKHKMTFLDGLVMRGQQWWHQNMGLDNEHGKGITQLWTGSAGTVGDNLASGPSVDQVVAKAIREATTANPLAFDSVELAVNAGDGFSHSRMIYAGPGQPLNPEQNPGEAFNRLFGNFSDDPQEQAELARRLAQKKSVIDAVRKDLNQVRGRIGAAERAKIEAHLEGIRALEQRLDGAGRLVCVKPAAPSVDTSPEAQIRAQADMIAAAFRCDLTRVMSLQMGMADGGVDVDGLRNHHEMAHATGQDPETARVELKKIDSWFATQMNYVLQQLDSSVEADGTTLLDNTLVVFGQDTTSYIYDKGSTHHTARFPMFMAGGGNFAYKTGRYLKFPGTPARGIDANDGDGETQMNKWVHHHRLLVSICQAFGVNVDKFGNADVGSGPLPLLEPAKAT